ncbi:hypothetical protein ACSBR2_021233 [Camellia fascicularis]
MPLSFSKLGNSLPFSRLFRQLEQEMETVIKVLEPGPLGVVEHKFSAEEICEANATVKRADFPKAVYQFLNGVVNAATAFAEDQHGLFSHQNVTVAIVGKMVEECLW